MVRKRMRYLVRVTAIILAISLCAPIGVQAAVPETVVPMQVPT